MTSFRSHALEALRSQYGEGAPADAVDWLEDRLRLAWHEGSAAADLPATATRLAPEAMRYGRARLEDRRRRRQQMQEERRLRRLAAKANTLVDLEAIARRHLGRKPLARQVQYVAERLKLAFHQGSDLEELERLAPEIAASAPASKREDRERARAAGAAG